MWKNMKKPMTAILRRVEQQSGVGWTRLAASTFSTSIPAKQPFYSASALLAMQTAVLAIGFCLSVRLSSAPVHRKQVTCMVNCRFMHSIVLLHLCKEYLAAVKLNTLF